MNTCGKKLRITGKGRCNITNSCEMSEFINNIPGNGKFLYSVFKNFTNDDIIDLLKEEGVSTKVERGNRIFPTTEHSNGIRPGFNSFIVCPYFFAILYPSPVDPVFVYTKNDWTNNKII